MKKINKNNYYYNSKDKRNLRLKYNFLNIENLKIENFNLIEKNIIEFMNIDLLNKFDYKENLEKFFISNEKNLYFIKLKNIDKIFMIRYISELRFLLDFKNKNKNEKDFIKFLIEKDFLIEENNQFIILDNIIDIQEK